jgi:hypothetical protein
VLNEKTIDYLDGDDNDDDDDDDEIGETSQLRSQEITFIELAMLNSYFYSSYKGKDKEVAITAYGGIDVTNRINFGGLFDIGGSFWFIGKVEGYDNDFLFQTRLFLDVRNELNIHFSISSKNGLDSTQFKELFKKIIGIAFNKSEYKGKCIKVKLIENRFKGIEIIDVKESSNELILNDIQKKFIEHFITRVSKGGTARYLLNGEPGTGKTESIREISRRLIPNVTFIIPDFSSSDDLTSILEACEIFENGVIIMDDIDLYLGSRDNGSYTRLLGQFLSFFDGVKKRKISLLASTNDKGLVDKAAERPGRFNFTLDYSFLDTEQIVKVCNIHLPEKWRVQEVYDVLSGTINGRKVNITGAFIANLADNIKEMSDGDESWSLDDTISLITESYKGFYSSQVEKERNSLGFKTN